MTARKKKHKARVAAPRVRAGRGRQRQRLIDACIAALHIFGPSRTTVEKVVAIAKMSPGIVRFYFDSKAAMLVAALQFLAAEFEEQVLAPVAALKGTPIEALQLLVDLYLDPQIASPRKVSVWYAFWGEASSRQEYFDICGRADERSAALVRELIEATIAQTSQRQLDADGIALGLIGVLEILWQDIAFQTERDIDRDLARRRAIGYLNSIFPGCFGRSSAAQGPVRDAHPDLPGAPPAGTSADGEALFRGAWSIVGHEAQIPQPGDSLAADIGVGQVLVQRRAGGAVQASHHGVPLDLVSVRGLLFVRRPGVDDPAAG